MIIVSIQNHYNCGFSPLCFYKYLFAKIRFSLPPISFKFSIFANFISKPTLRETGTGCWLCPFRLVATPTYPRLFCKYSKFIGIRPGLLANTVPCLTYPRFRRFPRFRPPGRQRSGTIRCPLPFRHSNPVRVRHQPRTTPIAPFCL